jgi:hypothetical protein
MCVFIVGVGLLDITPKSVDRKVHFGQFYRFQGFFLAISSFSGRLSR